MKIGYLFAGAVFVVITYIMYPESFKIGSIGGWVLAIPNLLHPLWPIFAAITVAIFIAGFWPNKKPKK